MSHWNALPVIDSAHVPVDVLVVDDCRLYRDGLVSILEKETDVGTVDAASDWGSTAIALEQRCSDVVLVNLSTRRSAELIALVRDRAPSSFIIAIGVGESDQEIVACAEAGVAGFLLRSEPFQHLMTLLRAVVAGGAVCSPHASAVLMRRLTQLADGRTADLYNEDQHRVPALTHREDQILGFMDAGMSNQRIAEHIGIELRTVKNHVHHILVKVGVSRRGEAVAAMRSLRSAPSGPPLVDARG